MRIAYIVQDCKTFGIETLDDLKLQQLIKEWGGRALIDQLPWEINLNDASAAAEEMARVAYSLGISLRDRKEATNGAACDFCGNMFEATPPKRCPICGSKIDGGTE